MDLQGLAAEFSGQDICCQQLPVRNYGTTVHEVYSACYRQDLRVEGQKGRICGRYSSVPVDNRMGSAFHHII